MKSSGDFCKPVGAWVRIPAICLSPDTSAKNGVKRLLLKLAQNLLVSGCCAWSYDDLGHPIISGYTSSYSKIGQFYSINVCLSPKFVSWGGGAPSVTLLGNEMRSDEGIACTAINTAL